MPSIIRYRPEMKGGLTRRTVIASGLLAVIIGAAFGVLVLSIVDLNRVEQRSRRSEEVLVVANTFERLIVDAETGVRGFVITRSEEFLKPWQAAQIDFPDQARMLEQHVADNPLVAGRRRRPLSRLGTRRPSEPSRRCRYGRGRHRHRYRAAQDRHRRRG
jgi:hypothetical protein